MADDQVKYSDLIADDVVKGFELLNQVMKDLQSTMASLKTEATNAGSVIKGMGSANRDQQQEIARLAAEIDRLKKQMKGLSDEEKKVTEIKRQYKKLTDDQIARVDKLASALGGLRTADEAQRKHALARINLINVENMSYNELQATYNALKDSLNAMTVAERQNTEAGKAMTVQSAKIYDTMNELQKATGKYTLQVGKYRAAFDGLGYSFQQILREAPSALNLNQFFLAISNNIPMFLDQLKAFKNEQAEIKANLATMTKGTAEYAEQLGKVESVGKKLGKVLVSWQSLVLVGLMILRNMDRIVAGISSLFNKVTKEQQRLNAVNEAAASTVGELTAKYKALQKEWQDLKAEDQGGWLEKHKNDWQELGYSIEDAKKAEDFYVNNTSAVQEAIDKRAKSIAGMKLAAEKYEEMFKAQVKAEKALTTMREMAASGTAYEYRKEQNRYIGNAASGSVTTITTPAGYYKTGAYAQAGLEYNMYRRQMEAFRKEAEEFMKFVQTDTAGGGGGNGDDGKEPKDQVDDLETLKRAWEDAVTENIENEYKRMDEAERLRHERFIKDKEAELELVKKDPERTAMINKQIEEEGRTHERNMEEIDEKRYQNLQALTQKRLADEKKEAEEKEKQEKDNAKNRLKAAVDGWAEYKAKLVKEGASRREIVEAEVAAEIARLKVIQELNRDINGEKMSDEQRQKVEEWIALLEKLQQTGNYGDYKPGQFIGEGGANVTNERKSYANIWEVLGIEMDSNQTSALNSVFDQAKEALNSWMDARKAAADQAKELADDEVSAAENALNREIELRNQGYANDVALREKELADAKEQQKKALEMQQKAKEEELAINTAMEASSMAVAIANLFKQFPIYVAIPLAATLLGAFGYAKLSALNQIRSTKYREGGVMLLEGGSHESGHDVNLGIGPDGSNLRAEGGEYFAVINKRNSRKYGSEIPAVVNALNSGMFEDKYIKTSDAVGLLPRTIIADNGSAVDLSAVESGVGQLVKQGESKWTAEGEYRVERYKNRVRRIKIG